MNPLIQATGLTKVFGDLVAVDGVDFAVTQGETFGFLGPNGAGKTSVMRMIGATSPISGGELSVLGLDPETYADALREGMRPQKGFRGFSSREQVTTEPDWLGELKAWATITVILVLCWFTYSVTVHPQAVPGEKQVQAADRDTHDNDR